MKLKIYLWLILFLLIANFEGSSADIRIRLFHPSLIKSVMISCGEGSYSVAFQGPVELSINSGDNIFIRASENKLWMRYKDGEWSQVKELYLTPVTERSSLRFKPAEPVLQDREYLGSFTLGLSHGNIELINIIDLEKYIHGGAALEAKVWKDISIVGQVFIQGSPFPKTGIAEVDRTAVLLSLGGRYHAEKNSVIFSLTEDPNTAGAPDITFNFTFKRNF